jgi:diaminopimelate decarboxylase
VIFLTGLSDPEHVVTALGTGGVDYVRKPIVITELLARIRVHLANARTTYRSRLALGLAGRSLVARAGVALYRVGAVKQTPHRRWLLLDGGMADNIRPALYGARYSALPVADPMRPMTGAAWLAGPFCESGDVLIHDLPMPEVAEGELIAVPASGAYHLMMGSNYNGALKPAVVWIHKGKARLIQRRGRRRSGQLWQASHHRGD